MLTAILILFLTRGLRSPEAFQAEAQLEGVAHSAEVLSCFSSVSFHLQVFANLGEAVTRRGGGAVAFDANVQGGQGGGGVIQLPQLDDGTSGLPFTRRPMLFPCQCTLHEGTLLAKNG